MLCPVGVAVVSECWLVLHSHVKASGCWVPVAARRIRLLRTERAELDGSHLALWRRAECAVKLNWEKIRLSLYKKSEQVNYFMCPLTSISCNCEAFTFVKDKGPLLLILEP